MKEVADRSGRAPDCCDISRAMEDYLKAFVHLEEIGVPATNGAIAERLGVSAPSVSVMLRRLRTKGFVDPCPDGRWLRLTRHGRLHGLRVVRRHRLIETFLVEILGMRWDQIHEEAERLEHALSPTLEAHLARLLGDPRFDPHGDPIPQADDHDVVLWPTALDNVPSGTRFRIDRVSDRIPELLRELTRLGVSTGSVLDVLGPAPEGEIPAGGSARSAPIRVAVGGKELELGSCMVSIIHGTVLDRR